MIFKEELNEVWRRRSLLWHFSVTDLKVRYKNSALGFFWSFLEPLLLLIILSLVFTHVFSFDIENYPLFLLANLILWNAFSRSSNFGLNSFLARAGILSKIYFPREIVVISAVLTAFMMFIFELVVFFMFIVAFQFVPTITLAFIPVPLIILFTLTLGISFALSVTNVFFRDMQSIWTIILQAGFFLTPIIYNLEMLPDFLQNILYFSPLVQIFEMFHNSILYNQLPTSFELTYTILTSIGILLIGYLIFYKYQAKAIEEL